MAPAAMRHRPNAGYSGQQGSANQDKKAVVAGPNGSLSARSSLRNTPHFGRNGSGRPMARVASEERLEMSRNLARDEFETQGPVDNFGPQRVLDQMMRASSVLEGQMLRASSARDLQPDFPIMSDKTETVSVEGMALLHGQIEEMKHERETLHRELSDVRHQMQEMQSWYESRINQLETRLDQASPITQASQQPAQGLTEADLRRLNNFCRKEVEVAELRKKIQKVQNSSSAQISQLDQHFQNQMYVFRNEIAEMLSGSPVRDDDHQAQRLPSSARQHRGAARRGRSDSPQSVGSRTGCRSPSKEYIGGVPNERLITRLERTKSPSPDGSPLACKSPSSAHRATIALSQAGHAQLWPSAAVNTAPGAVREVSPGCRTLFKAQNTASHPVLPHAQQLGSIDGVVAPAAPMSPHAILGAQHHHQATAVQSWAPQIRAPGTQKGASTQQPQRIVQVLPPAPSSRVSFGYSPRAMMSSPLRRGPQIS